MHFLYIAFLRLTKLEMFFSEARFLYLNKRKKETEQPLISQRGREKNFFHKAIYAHLHQRKHLLSRSNFFGIVFELILYLISLFQYFIILL